MQDLLTELLWRNDEITEAAHRLCLTLPNWQEAMEDYTDLAEQVRQAAMSCTTNIAPGLCVSPAMRSAPTTRWGWD